MRVALTIVVVVALLAAVMVVLFIGRLRAIAGRVGSFECAVRRGSRWVPGIAAYTVHQLVWYDVVSLSRRPRHRWDRDELVIEGRSLRPVDEHGRVLSEARCRHHDEPLEIAADPAAFEGLVSWLEASPPGARSHRVI